MMLTNLADVARRSGLTVIETAGWRTKGHGPMNTPKSVIVHHTAGSARGDAPSLNTVREGRPDLKGPLCHLLLSRNGTVYVIAAGLSYHAGATFETWQSNPYAIGIEVENTGSEPYPAAQMDALRRLARTVANQYVIPYARVMGHREVAKPAGRKVDPVFDMRAFRASLSPRPGGANA